MKRKILIAAIVLAVLAAGAFVAYKNTPLKRHARHLIKARLYAKEGNVTAARSEYEAAYSSLDGYTPWVSLEVLEFNNRAALLDKKPQDALENTRKFIETHPQSLEGKLMLAELGLRLGEVQIAFDQIERILTQDPGNFAARLMLTKLRTAQGRLDLAEEQLRYLNKLKPDSISVLLPLAENLLRQGHPAEARASLQGALEKHKDLPPLRLLIVDSYLFERKIDSAEALLAAWSVEDPKLAMPIQIRRARLLGARGRATEGLRLLDTFLVRDEKSLPAYEQAAYLHAQNGAFDSTLKLFDEMASLKPSLRAGLLQLGIYLHLKTGNPAKALENLKALTVADKTPALLPLTIAIYTSLDQAHKVADELAAFPDSVQKGARIFQSRLEPNRDFIGQWGLVNFFQSTGLKWLAFGAVRDWQKAWPKNYLATSMYANYLASLGQPKEALRLMETLVDTSLSHVQLLTRLSLAAGENAKAVKLAKQVEASRPNLPGLHQFLGDVALQSGQSSEAVTHYEKELALRPDNVAVINNLAWQYGVILRDFEKAKPHLDKLAGLKILDPRIYDTMGWIWVLAGQSEKGAGYLRTALDLVPDQPTFNYHEAYRLALAGNKPKAKEKVEMALSSGRPFPEKTSADSLLKAL